MNFFVDILFRHGPPDIRSADDQPLFPVSVRGREDFYVPLRGLQVTIAYRILLKGLCHEMDIL